MVWDQTPDLLRPAESRFRLADPTLEWPNHLSMYLLGPLDPIWISLMTDANTN